MSPGRKMVLNWRLVQAPIESIDYVIAYELCHVAEPHHGPAFFRLLERILPDWERRKKRLELVLVEFLFNTCLQHQKMRARTKSRHSMPNRKGTAEISKRERSGFLRLSVIQRTFSRPFLTRTSANLPGNEREFRLFSTNYSLLGLCGGERGIRTPDTLSSITVFKTAGFNRSPSSPRAGSSNSSQFSLARGQMRGLRQSYLDDRGPQCVISTQQDAAIDAHGDQFEAGSRAGLCFFRSGRKDAAWLRSSFAKRLHLGNAVDDLW